MDGENLISWNIPNFITIVLMIGIVWVVIGGAAHLLFGKKMNKNAPKTQAGVPQPMVGTPMSEAMPNS